jgi:hypothetical protein
MTEEEWLSTASTRELIDSVKDLSRQRRLRLLSCALCRHYEGLIRHDRVRIALDRAERFADGELRDSTLDKWRHDVAKIENDTRRSHLPVADIYGAVELACGNSRIRSYSESWTYLVAFFLDHQKDRSGASQVEVVCRRLLRDIFGNPFRPVSFDPEWRTSTAVALAQQMYDSRDFSAMPILADALQDAGCENEEVLDHCRAADGVHVRGCWVVDLVLGKS